MPTLRPSDNDEFDFDNDDELHAFCQEFDDDPLVDLAKSDFKKMSVSSDATERLSQHNAVIEMIERAASSVFANFIDDVVIFPENIESETTVILLHHSKTGNHLHVSLDMYHDRHGIAERQSCDGIIENGAVTFS